MELQETIKQVDETRDFLQESYNKLSALGNSLFPLTKAQIEALRSTRMTLQSESRETLKALEDVRRFFMDSDYEREMQRLERFVSVCRELQKLKQEGVLDDVADISVRMALRVEKGADRDA